MYYNTSNTYGYGVTAHSKEKPTFNLSVKKSRIKFYKDARGLDNAYMEDGQEFELELFNPRTRRVMARIVVNGVTDGELVLNPGQRVFLDRFVSNKTKLTFQTYAVDGSPESVAATVLNGVVVVEFYEETDYSTLQTPYIQPIWYTTQMPITCNGTGNIGLTTTGNNTVTSNYCASTLTFTSSLDGTKDFETGRIEAGDASEQEFGTAYGNFGTFLVQHKVKIWPADSMPAEFRHVKKYCSGCGVKAKAKAKYCSECGTKL